MSVLGTTVITLAEILAAVRLPAGGAGLRAHGGRHRRVPHLRTGGYLCGAPEVALIDMASLAMTRYYGLPSMSGGELGRQGRQLPGRLGRRLPAATSVLCGADLLSGAGLVDSDMAVSTAKTVLDCDPSARSSACRGARRRGRRVDAHRGHRRRRPRRSVPRAAQLARTRAAESLAAPSSSARPLGVPGALPGE